MQFVDWQEIFVMEILQGGEGTSYIVQWNLNLGKISLMEGPGLMQITLDGDACDLSTTQPEDN